MKETFKAKDLKFRQDITNKNLFVSVNAENSGDYLTDILVTTGKVVAYKKYMAAEDCLYEYKSGSDDEKYSNICIWRRF